MPFPVVKLYANVTHVFESTGNFRFHEVYKSIIILMYHLSTRFLENVEPKSVFLQSIIQNCIVSGLLHGSKPQRHLMRLTLCLGSNRGVSHNIT